MKKIEPLTAEETARYMEILAAVRGRIENTLGTHGEIPFALSGFALNLLRKAAAQEMCRSLGGACADDKQEGGTNEQRRAQRG